MQCYLASNSNNTSLWWHRGLHNDIAKLSKDRQMQPFLSLHLLVQVQFQNLRSIYSSWDWRWGDTHQLIQNYCKWRKSWSKSVDMWINICQEYKELHENFKIFVMIWHIIKRSWISGNVLRVIHSNLTSVPSYCGSTRYCSNNIIMHISYAKLCKNMQNIF